MKNKEPFSLTKGVERPHKTETISVELLVNSPNDFLLGRKNPKLQALSSVFCVLLFSTLSSV